TQSKRVEVSSPTVTAEDDQPEIEVLQVEPEITPEIVSTPATPVVESTSSVLDLDNIRGDWDLVKENIREISKPAEALLAAAFPRSLQNAKLEIGFLHQAHLQNFLDPKKTIANVVLVDALTTAVTAVFGDFLTLSFTHWPSMQEESNEASTSEETSAGHLLSEALSLGGTLIEQE
ncbi:MAG: hypothetical protein P8J64_03215, partial [Dehalococcoidia bacterium]|nr:hypothetical protein [Dehalococcoidia bacterium]